MIHLKHSPKMVTPLPVPQLSSEWDISSLSLYISPFTSHSSGKLTNFPDPPPSASLPSPIASRVDSRRSPWTKTSPTHCPPPLLSPLCFFLPHSAVDSPSLPTAAPSSDCRVKLWSYVPGLTPCLPRRVLAIKGRATSLP